REEPCRACTTRAEHSPDSIRRGCTASVFLRVSEYFCGVHLDFPPWATPNTGGSDPSIPQTFFVRLPLLGDDCSDSCRVGHRQAETGWRTIVEYIDCIPVDFECLCEGVGG